MYLVLFFYANILKYDGNCMYYTEVEMAASHSGKGRGLQVMDL